MNQLMTPGFVELIKRYNGAVVLDGYDPVIYIVCLVFKRKEDRDKFGDALSRRGLEFDERAAAIIPRGYENW